MLDHLNAKKLLLILDNFDHLLESATVVTEILRAAPRVRLLITSRERLNLSGETIFRLGGMNYPRTVDDENALEYSAVQLFLQASQRVRQDFAPEPGDLAHVARVCRLVQGMPLGIILAANWVRILSPWEIDEEITQSIDFLASEQRDLPKRLRSIRAVFDYSWKMMTPAEARAFANLCVFRGGFTRTAATAVAGMDLRLLITLSNKSLVQHDADRERYRAGRNQQPADTCGVVVGGRNECNV